MAEPTNEQLREILEDMVTARVQSTRLWNLQRQGRIGTFPPLDGHEAAIAGAAHALDPEHDWIIPQYREPPALQYYGPEILYRFVLYHLGHPAGGHIPAPVKVLPPQVSLGSQIPHAVGIAWGMKLRNDPGVALVFFGDGSTSEGDFYEGGNLAGVLQVPVILLCVNNQWAISTPVHLQTASESFAIKAKAFGIPGVQIDGNNAAEVYDAVSEARIRALEGKGPTLIEAKVYRLGPHTTADDPTRYVPADELEEARQKDPTEQLKKKLTANGFWDDSVEKTVEEDALRKIDQAFENAKATPIEPDAILNHCFADDTPQLSKQRKILLKQQLGSNQ